MPETWLETEAEASRATGPAAAGVLSAFAETLQEAPDDRRYDVTVTVTEECTDA